MAARTLRTGIALAALLASTGLSHAGGFALREQSAVFLGSAFAGAAAPGGGLSSMYWNPATITASGGIQFESVQTGIQPNGHLDIDPTGTPNAFLGDPGDVGVGGYVPSMYASYQINDMFYAGLSVNAPFGLATRSNPSWAGMTDHYRAKVMSITATPTLGIKVNDMLSFGIGVEVQYFKVNLQRALFAFPGSPTATLEGDDFGFGFTAGVTFTPMEGTEIGLGFRSSIGHSLDGEIALSVPGSVDTPIGADVSLPETITLGIRQRVTDQFTVLAGAEWSNWSRLGTIDVVTDAGGVATQLDFRYEDGWFLALGGEYRWNDALTLRAGAAYEWSPVQDENRSMRLPDADRLWLSVGASYAVNDRITVDAAYSHLFIEDAPVNVEGVYRGTSRGDADIVSVSLRYKL